MRIGRGGRGDARQDPPIFRTQAYAAQSFDVSISDALVEMADATPVYHWRFEFTNPALPNTFPGPVIVATAGEPISINLINTLDEQHAFAVMGALVTHWEILGDVDKVPFPKEGDLF